VVTDHNGTPVYTSLHFAAGNGHTETRGKLVGLGAALETQNTNRCIPGTQPPLVAIPRQWKNRRSLGQLWRQKIPMR
jgi:hypothetical protein